MHAPALNFRIFVDDLSAESDERLRARLMTDVGKLALLALRHARDEDLMDRLELWADVWAAIARAPSALMALGVIVSYIAHVSPSGKERLARLIPTDAEEACAIMPTMFEKERQEGRQEGVLAGQREMIKKLLRQRFGEVPPEIVQQIEQADAPSLDRWAERLLSAPTLAAVFA